MNKEVKEAIMEDKYNFVEAIQNESVVEMKKSIREFLKNDGYKEPHNSIKEADDYATLKIEAIENNDKTRVRVRVEMTAVPGLSETHYLIKAFFSLCYYINDTFDTENMVVSVDDDHHYLSIIIKRD